MNKECINCLDIEKANVNSPSEEYFNTAESPCSLQNHSTKVECSIWRYVKGVEMREWQFTHSVHDAKGEIALASLYIQVALKENRYPDMASWLRRVNSKILQASDGMSDAMDLKKIENRQVVFNFEPIPVHAWLDKLVEEYSVAHISHQFVLEVSPEINDVCGDRRLVSRVVNNLLANAVKYSPKGGEVKVCADEEGKLIHFCVTDRGIGIPLGNQNLIFEKFGRAQGAERFEGLGVGLALAKQIVEEHQGKIWASSPEEGLGASFHFTLPIYQHLSTKSSKELVAAR